MIAACVGASVSRVAIEDEAPPPTLAPAVVKHEPGAIVPKIEWHTSAIARAAMTLTTGDGAGLRLVAVTGTVVIEDPLAFTELRLAFENPETRRLEGRFEMDLPPAAALSRLAMKIGDRWMEGEVVERTRAQRTFESYIHERPNVDPALLEKAAANRVAARVFPIEPRQTKEIIVSYSQPIGAGDADAYRLPLQGLPKLDALDVRVIVKTHDEQTPDRFRAASQRVLEVREREFSPTEDLVVALEGEREAAALRSDALAAVRVRPLAIEQTDPIDALVVLFDTSASTARTFDAQVDRLTAFLQALGDTPVRLVVFDQTIEPVYDGPAARADGDAIASIRERRAFGASNLAAALEHPALAATGRRLLVWSDGIATAGATRSPEIQRAAADVHAARIDAFAPSMVADRDTLAGLTTRGDRSGIVTGPDDDGPTLARRLAHAAFGDVEITVPGADWSYPSTLAGIAPGDDVVVHAAFARGAPERIRVDFSDAAIPSHVIGTRQGAAPLLARTIAQARVRQLQAELERTNDAQRIANVRDRIVTIATEHRILCDFTALLVLESEAEYRRFAIARNALADVLTADNGGIEVLRRGAGPTARRMPLLDDLLADGDRSAIAQDDVAAIAGASGHFLASPYGGAFAVGNDDEDVWGGVSGTEIGEAFGVGGLGLAIEDGDMAGTGRVAALDHIDDAPSGTRHRGEEGTMGPVGAKRGDVHEGTTRDDTLGLIGTGRGGGGTGEGTIGVGNFGVIGRGGGSGTGAGYGRGAAAGFGGRGQRVPAVRLAKPEVHGALDKDIVRRIVRAHVNEVRHCYDQALVEQPTLDGRVVVTFTIGATGSVPVAIVQSSTTGDANLDRCIATVVKRWRFPAPGASTVQVTFPFVLSADGGTSTSWSSPTLTSTPAWSRSAASRGRARIARARSPRRRGEPRDGPQWIGSAHTGRFAQLQRLVTDGELQRAHEEAWTWATTEPDNALALVALGEILEIQKRPRLAARVYGSLIDLYPHRADMRRAAGARLEAIGDPADLDLAIDSYRKAVEQRPDHINGHRLLAWALVKTGDHAKAFSVLGDAIATSVPAGRFVGVKDLLREDRSLVAAAWLAASPQDVATIEGRLRTAGVRPATQPSLRLVADWETDATDVDLLVDPVGRGSGRRHADVRNGFGPEAWIARGDARPDAVSARVRYFDRGAMGYAMGTVSAIRHDGNGTLTFEDRPFVLMQSVGSVALGHFRA